ncbi:hypothetical protein F5Y18DRAFT_439480 [Xylariaceae sp. FL1019]|nr:hypothetical protein F5Y18DRAFT_439480 [Xylariaceae sp. FL1019]
MIVTNTTATISIPSMEVVTQWLGNIAQAIKQWLFQPHVQAPIIAWVATFTAVMCLAMCFGFGRKGVVFATLAAAWQSYAYGAFTPAGGIFATLTSMAMLGTLMPAAAKVAAALATLVALVVWVRGVGRV